MHTYGEKMTKQTKIIPGSSASKKFSKDPRRIIAQLNQTFTKKFENINLVQAEILKTKGMVS